MTTALPLLREALRVLPDVLRLPHRLAVDKSLPSGARIRLALLLPTSPSRSTSSLTSSPYFIPVLHPRTSSPYFIPVLGYADDAIIVTATLRSVVRRAGLDAVRGHWPGIEDGFAAVVRLTGISRGAR